MRWSSEAPVEIRGFYEYMVLNSWDHTRCADRDRGTIVRTNKTSNEEDPMDEKTLQGQTALVTGATSGIGRAAANALAAEGATVIVHGRDAARGAEVVEELRAAGADARFLAAELGDADQVRELAAAVGDGDIL